MALWGGAEVKPGKDYVHTFSPSKGRLQITRATLGNPKSLDWCFLEARVGHKRKATICVLHPNSKPTCGLKLKSEDRSVTFSVKGENTIHLSGYYTHTKTCTVDGPTLLEGIDQEMPHRNKKKARRDDFASNTDHESGDEERNDGNEKINATPTLSHHKKKVAVVNKSSGITTSKECYDISDSDDEKEDVLIHEIMTKGRPNAKVATNGSKVRVDFVGCFKDGTVFEKQESYQFTLGAGKVVPGWEIGIRGMKVGEKKKLIFSPSLGYGNLKQEKVPANSWLIYTIKLLEVEEATRTKERVADA